MVDDVKADARRLSLAEDDFDRVGLSVGDEGDLGGRAGLAVQRDLRDAAGRAARVFDRELVARRVGAEGDLVARPRAGDAGVQVQRRAAETEAQDPFHARAVHPDGRAGVPGPPTAPDVPDLRVDAGRGDVRLDLVAVEARPGARVIDRD